MHDPHLTVEYLPIEELQPYERNTRKHEPRDIAAIRKSIEDFGFNDPIGIWHDTIVEGHGRLYAARELGMTEVPVIRLDHLDDEGRRAYAIAHNKTAENSEWDMPILTEELRDLEKYFDMTDFGFDTPVDDAEPAEVVEDEVPEVPEEPKAKVGDLYVLGRWVYCKKCGKRHYIS